MPRFDATSTPLAGNATYLGGQCQTDTYDSVGGTVYSDQSGTAYIDQSTDGVNWDFTTTIAVTGGTGAVVSVPLVAPIYRLRYVNGATPQTTFRFRAKAQAAGTR